MKRIVYVLVAFIFTATVVQAANKIKVKYGPIKYKATNSAASVSAVGSDILIVAGGNKGTTSGTFTITLDDNELSQLAKGLKLGVVGVGNDSDNDNAVTILFQGLKVKIKGTSSTSTGYSSTNDTKATGVFKVLKYNEETRELKFSLVAKASPYTRSKAKLGGSPTNKTVTKSLPIKVTGTVTL